MPDSTMPFHTFRDPAGSLRIEGGQVLRTVRPNLVVTTEAYMTSNLARELSEPERMFSANSLGLGKDGALDLEHRDISFPSYPWEWCADQWIDAGVLTLDICDRILDHGLTLNSATPMNIQFDHSRPVLVDTLAIQPRDPENPVWGAYGQFVRTFILPLIAHKCLGWPLAAFRFRNDGYEPRELYLFLPLAKRWLGPARNFVTLPVLFDRFGKDARLPSPMKCSNQASVARIRSRLRALKKAILALRPRHSASRCSGYAENRQCYSKRNRIRKAAFVKRVLHGVNPGTVLDLGAGTGSYSYLASACGAAVLAMDVDSAATAIHYDKTRRTSDPVLPFIADITRPTPPAGWKNLGSLSLLDRCRGRFDCVLMLGLLHHMLVSDKIPLKDIAGLIAEIAPHWLVVEWVSPSDPMFVSLSKGREALYADLTEEAFLEAFASHFQVVEREQLPNGRILFLMEAGQAR
jgi:hypothetical protein